MNVDFKVDVKLGVEYPIEDVLKARDELKSKEESKRKRKQFSFTEITKDKDNSGKLIEVLHFAEHSFLKIGTEKYRVVRVPKEKSKRIRI